LLAGAALGTLLTYITKDEELRKTVENFYDGCVDSFKSFLVRMTPEKGDTQLETSAESPSASHKNSLQKKNPANGKHLNSCVVSDASQVCMNNYL